MKSFFRDSSFCVFALLLATPLALPAAKLVGLQPVDDRCLVLHWQDGRVDYHWDNLDEDACGGWGPLHTENWHLCNDKDEYVPFGDPLDTVVTSHAETFLITSADDERFGTEGVAPVASHRKSKVWEAAHDERKAVMHHWVYLELPHSLQSGATYQVLIDTRANSSATTSELTWDPADHESPAIKASHAGYPARAASKLADVYLWMGDGGGRDFSRLTDNPWSLVDDTTGETVHTGTLAFRLPGGPEVHSNLNLTEADVWECDFSDFSEPGTYRLVINGIGSSAPFEIGDDVMLEPFRTAMQGMFYQRMGCDEAPAGNFPLARRPLYKQGVEPAGFQVLISARDMVTGVNPDNRAWYAEELTGEVAPETWGGWSDAYDNDQRPPNFICVFDILLAYYLNPAAFSDNQLYVPETDNGVPDILDEALWEIDWWLRMRDRDGGYLTGLTNIKPPQTTNYAGAPAAWQGWCVAAGAAMVADCFRLAGDSERQDYYLQAALEAFAWAQSQDDQMLDFADHEFSGRDLRMTAAAYLFNLTGKRDYEAFVMADTLVDAPESVVLQLGQRSQQYATVGYLSTPHAVADPGLPGRMRTTILRQALSQHVEPLQASPTRSARWTGAWDGMAKTSAETTLLTLAHHFSEDAEIRKTLEAALNAETEFTFGRNPLGLVTMTGLTDRAVDQTFAPGRRDGYPGLTPGWTPYMCRDGWGNADDIHRCGWYTNRNYPADKTRWPHGEHFWNSRYSVPNSEATPHQTFRQKILLYGYLYALYDTD